MLVMSSSAVPGSSEVAAGTGSCRAEDVAHDIAANPSNPQSRIASTTAGWLHQQTGKSSAGRAAALTRRVGVARHRVLSRGGATPIQTNICRSSTTIWKCSCVS